LKATFGAGCFWHVEDIFSKTKGISSTKVGYIGGQLPNPTYEEVCTDKTGHAEAVQVEYDPDEISFEELLDVFWKNHNPTTLNRQGPDVGIQYRSAIFFHDEKQKDVAEKSKQTLDSSGVFNNPIITQIVPAPIFYAAEEYHQKYFKKHGLS
jgi:peptide-methionine (S)-S-oxide reductase